MGVGFPPCGNKVMVVLLEEEQAERESPRRRGSSEDAMSFSEGRSRLNTGIPLLRGGSDDPCVCVWGGLVPPPGSHPNPKPFVMTGPTGRGVSQVRVRGNAVMSVHAPAAGHGEAPLDGCTLICTWNIWEPSRPQKVLVYQSEVKGDAACMNLKI